MGSITYDSTMGNILSELNDDDDPGKVGRIFFFFFSFDQKSLQSYLWSSSGTVYNVQ